MKISKNIYLVVLVGRYIGIVSFKEKKEIYCQTIHS